MSTELDRDVQAAVAKGYTRKDELILLAAESGLTPEQIADQYNMTPASVVLRIKSLLGSSDYLTEYEKKQLLLNSAFRFKAVLDSGIGLVADDPKLASNYIRTLEMLSKLLKEQGEISERELRIINDAQMRAIVGAVEKAFYVIARYLRENNPEVDINKLNAEFRKAVQEGLVINDTQQQSD